MSWTPSEERALFHRVLAVVNDFDLMGLEPGAPDGAPIDEYTTEARAIESLLVNGGGIDFGGLSAIHLAWFENDLRGREEGLRPLVEALNELVTRYPGRSSG
jgi:hypothetical protein